MGYRVVVRQLNTYFSIEEAGPHLSKSPVLPWGEKETEEHIMDLPLRAGVLAKTHMPLNG